VARRSSKASGLVQVTLLAPHTHRRIERMVGDKLTLRPDQASRLIDLGTAGKTTTARQPKTEPVSENAEA